MILVARYGLQVASFFDRQHEELNMTQELNNCME